MSLTRINEFKAAAGKSDQLFAFLQSLQSYILNSEGCSLYEVLRSQDNADEFVVIEKWSTTEAHQASIAGYPKEDMQAAMSLFGAPPKGGYFVSE